MFLLPLAKSNSLISAIPPETIPVVIFIVSIVAFTIIIERSIYFGRFKSILPDDLREVKDLLRAKNFDKAKDVLEQRSRGPATTALGLIIDHKRRNYEHIADEFRSEAYRQIFQMERYLTGLGTIATISPLLGVLGTVLGMIRAFAEGTGTKGAETGISEALITTAMGLGIAIPAYVFYNYFVKKKEEKISEMENLSEQILPILVD
jgi:biopolymer transport protein ExbB/TolQ